MQDENEEIEIEEEIIEEEGLKDKMKKLRDDLKTCRKEREEYLAGWQRAKADFINARKEEEKAREGFIKFSQAEIILSLLPVLDSLEMALLHGVSGLKEIHQQFYEILKQKGAVPMEAIGKKFNPTEHEAISQEEVLDPDKDDVVIDDLQKGWYLHEKVLRPAKVKVGHYKNKE
ncbi:nucleotide exchange factor GrpE [Candidatus Giovannonibacteria bacterium]|nr:nucleotide exchange factor GrpE [Candidatus Giovannonibacteria bacterium]